MKDSKAIRTGKVSKDSVKDLIADANHKNRGMRDVISRGKFVMMGGIPHKMVNGNLVALTKKA